MTQAPQQQPLADRVTQLERDMSDLKTAAEALLQTAQIHQRNFETVSTELLESRRSLETVSSELLESRRNNERRTAQLDESRHNLLVLTQHQLESDQRFEVLLAELRQLRNEGDEKFKEINAKLDEQHARLLALQAEHRRILDRLLNPSNSTDLTDPSTDNPA